MCEISIIKVAYRLVTRCGCVTQETSYAGMSHNVEKVLYQDEFRDLRFRNFLI